MSWWYRFGIQINLIGAAVWLLGVCVAPTYQFAVVSGLACLAQLGLAVVSAHCLAHEKGVAAEKEET